MPYWGISVICLTLHRSDLAAWNAPLDMRLSIMNIVSEFIEWIPDKNSLKFIKRQKFIKWATHLQCADILED